MVYLDVRALKDEEEAIFEAVCTFLPASALYRWEREEGPLETLGRVSPEEFWPGCSEQVERPSSTREGLTSGKPATFPA